MKKYIFHLTGTLLLALATTLCAADEKRPVPVSTVTLNTSGKAVPITSVAQFGKEAIAVINRAVADNSVSNQKVGIRRVEKSTTNHWQTKSFIYQARVSDTDGKSRIVRETISPEQIPQLKAHLEREIKTAVSSRKALGDIANGTIDNTFFVGRYNIDLFGPIKTKSNLPSR